MSLLKADLFPDRPLGVGRGSARGYVVCRIIKMPLSHVCALFPIPNLTVECSKDYIPPGVLFVLRWQLSPTQMKCTCDANDSIYILYAFFIKMRHNKGSVVLLCKKNNLIYYFYL